MMAERQVLIVKEAQDLSRTIEKRIPVHRKPTTHYGIGAKLQIQKNRQKRKKLYKATARNRIDLRE